MRPTAKHVPRKGTGWFMIGPPSTRSSANGIGFLLWRAFACLADNTFSRRAADQQVQPAIVVEVGGPWSRPAPECARPYLFGGQRSAGFIPQDRAKFRSVRIRRTLSDFLAACGLKSAPRDGRTPPSSWAGVNRLKQPPRQAHSQWWTFRHFFVALDLRTCFTQPDSTT